MTKKDESSYLPVAEKFDQNDTFFEKNLDSKFGIQRF